MVPNNWTSDILGNVTVKVGSGTTPKGGSRAYKTSGIPLIRSQNVLWGNLDLSDVAFIDENQHRKMRSSLVYKNDVLLNITGASIGRASLSNLEEANVNQHVCIIRPTADLSPNFLKNYLLSYYGQKQIEQYQAGGNRQGLNFDQIKSFRIPLPPLAEQSKISEIFDTWDRAISTTEKLVKASKQQKAALLQQLLTGKKRFSGFEKEWQTRSLYKCLSGSSLRNKDLLMSHGDLRSVTKARGMVPMKDQVKGESVERCKVVKHNWFAYNPMRLNVGSICRWKGSENCLVSPDYVVFSCNEDVLLTEYFDHFRSSHSWNDFMLRAGNGSVRVRIYLKDLAPLKIQLPSVEEQRQIASVLTAASKEVEILEGKLTHLKQEKKALMQQLLTGKRRVQI